MGKFPALGAAALAISSMSTCLYAQRSYETRLSHITSVFQEETLTSHSLGIADSGSARALSPYSLTMIEEFEAWVSHPYNDASHYCTVGYGHLIAKRPCAAVQAAANAYQNPLPKQAGLALLGRDTAGARTLVSQLVQVNLNDQQFGALVSFVFNVGGDNFRNSSLLQFINNSEFDGAARQFGRWVRSNGVVLNGLVDRRACEAALFQGKIPLSGQHVFRRADCASLGAAPEVEDLIDIKIGERR